MSLLDHQELSIVKGVGPTPSDTLSAEQPLTIVDLLTTGSAFGLVEWTPNIPSLKSGGVWADSSITDGRTLIAAVNTNVIETIVVQLTGSTIADFASQFAKFQLMIQDARDFWDTFRQIEPVYIRWWANQAPGPQFALIYNIDMDVEWSDSNLAQATLTLKVEREFGWRGIRPGGNPKEWYIENVLGSQIFNSSNAALLTGSAFLLFETGLVNRAEQNAAQTGYTVKNFVDIPATSIPGDLPALACISFGKASSANDETVLFMSKTTARNTNNTSRRTGTNQYLIHVLNAADAFLGTDTTLAADTGASTGISGLQRRSQTTFATATLINRLTWSSNNYTGNGFSLSVVRGRYAVFCRARLSAAATTVNLALDVVDGTNSNQTTTPVAFTNQGSTGTGNTTTWGVAYLGEINIPNSDRKTNVSGNGLGIAIDLTGSTEISIALQASRTAGAGVLYVNDIFLMPIDEGAVLINSPGGIAETGGGGIVYDNTGYLTHGQTNDFAVEMFASGSTYATADIPSVAGSPIYLTPKISNRLEFFTYTDSTKLSFAITGSNNEVRVSIVPRWSAIRDA